MSPGATRFTKHSGQLGQGSLCLPIGIIAVGRPSAVSRQENESMNLTPAQLEAIAARGNVLVVAGAGTGKTRTLVERCLNCLLAEKPRVSLEEILMVTFTDA